MKHTEIKEGIYIGFREKDYAERMLDKERMGVVYSQLFNTPKEYELSPYKLHISLSEEDYLKHKETIRDILLRYLKKGYLNDFKMTIDPSLISEKIAASRELIDLLQDYKKILAGGEVAGFNLEVLTEKFDHFYQGKSLPLPGIDEVDAEIHAINNFIKTTERFIHGDQFTIYIPIGYDRRKFLALCREINSCLVNGEEKAVPGVHYDIASPIGSYINFRQEFLLEEYNLMNERGRTTFGKRIDTVQLDDSAEENSRREKVKMQQDSSKLYQYLSGSLVREERHRKVRQTQTNTQGRESAGLFSRSKSSEKKQEVKEEEPQFKTEKKLE